MTHLFYMIFQKVKATWFFTKSLLSKKVDKNANLLSPLQKFQIATIAMASPFYSFFFGLMPMKAISFPSPWATQPKEAYVTNLHTLIWLTRVIPEMTTTWCFIKQVLSSLLQVTLTTISGAVFAGKSRHPGAEHHKWR